MGNIQNSINQMLGTAATAATLGKHIGQQKTSVAEQTAKKNAEIAETREQQTADKLAYKNDTIEGALAIYAHRGDSYTIGDQTISRADYDAFDPVIKGKKMSEYDDKDLSAALQGLKGKEIDDLSDAVEDYRKNVLSDMDTRRLAAASNLTEEGTKTLKEAQTIKLEHTEKGFVPRKEKGIIKQVPYEHTTIKEKYIPGEYISNKDFKNKELEKAYIAERELNDRIAASRELKFDISAAEEKINRLQGGKK